MTGVTAMTPRGTRRQRGRVGVINAGAKVRCSDARTGLHWMINGLLSPLPAAAPNTVTSQ